MAGNNPAAYLFILIHQARPVKQLDSGLRIRKGSFSIAYKQLIVQQLNRSLKSPCSGSAAEQQNTAVAWGASRGHLEAKHGLLLHESRRLPLQAAAALRH